MRNVLRSDELLLHDLRAAEKSGVGARSLNRHCRAVKRSAKKLELSVPLRLTRRADRKLEAIYRYTFENFGAAAGGCLLRRA